MEFIKSLIKSVAFGLALALILVLLPKVIPQSKPLVQKIHAIMQNKLHPVANEKKNNSTPIKNEADNRYLKLWSTQSQTYAGTYGEQLDSLMKVFIEFNNKNNSGITNKFSCTKFEEVSAPVKKFIDQLPVVDPSDFDTRDALSAYSSSITWSISFCKTFSDMGPQTYTYSLLTVKNILLYLNWYRYLKLYEESGSASAEVGYAVHKWEKLYKDSSDQLKAIGKRAADQASKPVTIPTIESPKYISPTLGNKKTYCTSKRNWKGEIETTCSDSPVIR